MSFFIVPDLLKAKFLAAEEPLTLCLSDGRVIGYFTPNKERKFNWEPPQLPPGELDQRAVVAR